MSQSPRAQDFIERRVEEITSIDGLDGIHFDYIRFPDVVIAEALQPKYGIVQHEEQAPYDYCYCDVCRSKFERDHGADPYDLEDPATSTAWRLFRYESITNLVNDRLIPIARENGKAVSAATFPNWEAVRQRWHHWDLDYVHPMLYHNFYHAGANWVRDETRAGIERLRGTGPVHPPVKRLQRGGGGAGRPGTAHREGARGRRQRHHPLRSRQHERCTVDRLRGGDLEGIIRAVGEVWRRGFSPIHATNAMPEPGPRRYNVRRRALLRTLHERLP
ncbi:hypothetical protein [Salinibacter ruber]|uniref:hypothetical protein n=1 Tax=Salinibacter ruber TaxID=146919 RepID=UPI002072A729|nr:hypothetical protein [Salinibacter ruber]